MFHHTTLTADDPHERAGTRCHPPPKLSQHIEHFAPGRSSSRVRFLTLIALRHLRLLYILKRAPGAGTAGSSGPGQLVEDATSSLVQNPHTKVLTINFAGGFNTTRPSNSSVQATGDASSSSTTRRACATRRSGSSIGRGRAAIYGGTAEASGGRLHPARAPLLHRGRRLVIIMLKVGDRKDVYR
jgi:hypothetical protein